MPAPILTTPEAFVARFAEDIAFVADEPTATTIDDFVSQVYTAASNAEAAGITVGEELPVGARYLADAHSTTDDTERAVLLKRAAEYLSYTRDMADEYRLMV